VKIEEDFLAGLHKRILSEAEWKAGNDSARKGFWKTALMLPILAGWALAGASYFAAQKFNFVAYTAKVLPKRIRQLSELAPFIILALFLAAQVTGNIKAAMDRPVQGGDANPVSAVPFRN
jgi:hypothetical protein